MAAPAFWGFPFSWLLCCFGSVGVSVCSVSLVLLWTVAAHVLWFCQTPWLLTASGSVKRLGCSRSMVLSAFMAVLFRMVLSRDVAVWLPWFCPLLWLFSFHGSVEVRAVHALWFCPIAWLFQEDGSCHSVWLFDYTGPFCLHGCSTIVVLSSGVAVLLQWFCRG